MNLQSCVLLCGVLVLIYTVAVTAENANSKKKVPKKEEKADFFIDGDTEGSGSENLEGMNDLESSGSGNGPDDEDAELDNGDTLPNGSKSRVTLTNSNTVPKVITEPNKDPGTFPVLSTSTSAVTIRPVSHVEEKNTKSYDESVDKNGVREKGPGANDATNTDRSPIDDVGSNSVYVVNTPERDRTTSFFAQPGILAAVIGGAVVGLLCAILVVMFIVYRMRKKDEGSYPLEEMKRCPATNPYIKPNHREFFA